MQNFEEVKAKQPIIALRDLAEEAKAIFRADPETKEIRDDWRSPTKLIRPVFNEKVGRDLGVSREDLAYALQVAMYGTDLFFAKKSVPFDFHSDEES